MGVPWAAILAVALGGHLDEPRYVRFQTAEGSAVSGDLTAWDAQGFDGSFGRRAWKELAPADAWRVYVMVMDRGDAAQWVDLGRALLEAPQGETWADRAFRKAIELDRTMEARVQEARAELRRLRDQTRQAADAQRLRTQTPEAVDWPATPWAPQGPAIRQAALEALRVEVPAMLSRSGIALELVETEHYLVYADLPRLEAAQLGARLESMHQWLADLLTVDAKAPHYWGKAVVIHLADPDRFRLIEAESFGQLVDRDTTAICHPVGEKVFIVLRGDPAGPEALRAAVHAFMHRYHTPRRLPAWANEGLATYAAARLSPGAWAEAGRRGAIQFLRGGGDVRGLLSATYAQGWPGPQAAGPAVGALLVELLVTQKQLAFVAWVSTVKDGKEWAAALDEVYGSPARLVDTFVQYYRVND